MSSLSSVLLVDCGLTKEWGNPFPYRSLGLLSCWKYLQAHGSDVRFAASEEVGAGLPFQSESVEAFVATASAEHPDFIGFATTSDNLPLVLYLAEAIVRRQLVAPSRILLGGIGASSYPEQVLAHYPFVDIIVVGEGEETLLELMAAGLDLTKWSEITGLAYRDEDGAIRVNPPRPRIVDLDTLPDVYCESKYRVPGYTHERHTCFASTSRGCTGHCLFCSHSLIWKGETTRNSAVRVLELMEKMVAQHPGAHIAFQDDDFLSCPERIAQLADGLVARGLEVPWAIFGRLDRITPELLHDLARGGCRSIVFGLDAITQEGTRGLGKPWSFQESRKVLHNTRDHIPGVEFNLIYGWAGETRENFHVTLREAYALRLEGFQVKLAPLTIYPNTPIHRLYSRRWALLPQEAMLRPLLGAAYRYVEGHEELYPHLCANSFDPDFQAKKRLIEPLRDAFVIYDEV